MFSGKSTLSLVFALSTLFFATVAAAGPRAYVGNFKDNTVSVIDTGSGSVLGTVPVAPGTHGMAISSNGHWLYVSSDGSSTVSVIDTTSKIVSRTIQVGQKPHGVALTPDGALLLVAVNGEDRIAFVDTLTNAVVGSVGVPKPHTVSIDPNGKMAYVTSQQAGNFGIAVVDIAGRTLNRMVRLDKQPRDLQVGADGKAAYFTEMGVNAVEVLDIATGKIAAEVPTGVSPHYVNQFPGMTLGVAVVQGPGELLLFDPATNKPVRSIKVGKQPHWAAASSDGKTVYVTDEGSNDLTIVDVASGKTAKVAVGNQPRKVVVH